MRALAPSLSPAEHVALVAAWQTTHDTRARERLLAASEPLMWSVATRYVRCGAEWEDLVAEARLALIEACDTYPGGGREWAGHAYEAMRRAVVACVRTCQRAAHDALEDVEADALADVAAQDEEIDRQARLAAVHNAAWAAAGLSPFYAAIVTQRLLAVRPVALLTLARQLGCNRRLLAAVETTLLDRLAGQLAPLCAEVAL